jgi:hypothetical protein
MRDEMSPVLEATLEAARSTARAVLRRSLDDAVASTSDAWRRELDRVSEAWASERRELEARCASLAERADELEARNATLAQQLRAAEAAGAMAAAETRKTRAELDEARDDVDARRDKMRAELEVWRESSVKYRKRMEHAERALARVKARANAAGFVEATQLTPDHAPTRRRPSREPPPTTARATETTPEERAGSPAAPSPAPGPALAPVATAAAKKRNRPPHPAPGVENIAAIASGARMDPPNRADVETRRLGTLGPAAAGPSSKWRRTGGGAALRDEPSLRANGVGADVAHLWGDGSPRVGAARGGGGGFAPRRAGDAFAEEDRNIFKIAPRRDARGGLDGGGEALPARNGDERNPTTRGTGTGTGTGTGPVGARRETKRVEVIRDKATRAALPAFTCEECDKFYAAAERSGVERPRGACTHRPGPGMHNSWSRHRARWAPPPAPEGFWNLGMTQTQKTTTDAGGG